MQVIGAIVTGQFKFSSLYSKSSVSDPVGIPAGNTTYVSIIFKIVFQVIKSDYNITGPSFLSFTFQEITAAP